MRRDRPKHRRRRAIATGWAVLAVAGATALVVGTASDAPARATSAALSTSAGPGADVLPGLAKATDRGPAPADGPLTLVVSLTRPDPAGEQALLAAEHDPGSSQFGRYLTPGDFAARFGVPADRLAALTGWLSAGGLRVNGVSAARDQVSVTGTADAVARRFGTRIDAFDSPDGPFWANTTTPAVPGELGVANVVGLNTLQRMHTGTEHRPAARGQAETPPPKQAGPAQGSCAGAVCTGGTTPADLWSVYEQPPALTGHGQRVAIFGGGRTDGVIADLRVFEKRFGLANIPVAVHHPAGDADFSDDSGHLEWNIDTQASQGMAPGLDGLDLYFGESLADADVARMFSQFTDDEHSPRQASASFGECEQAPVVSKLAATPLLSPQPQPPVAQQLGNNLDDTLTAITRQAAIEGKTIFSSTGDTGSSCPVVSLPVVATGNGVLNQGYPLTNSPASLPQVVAVGGTVLYTDGAGHRAREYGWTFGGGGSSLITPAPDYQRGTPGLTVPCPVAGGPCRGVPDVSAQSGDVTGNGYDIVSAGRFRPGDGGGTSLSSPLWAGMWARVQSAAPEPGGLGFANYAFYRLGKDPAAAARDFHDISSTDARTGVPSTNGLYPALPGWDYQAGWGTPRVAGLACDLAHRC